MGGRSGARLRPPGRPGGTKGSGRFVVITGLSGSGKSQAIRALEDLGYFCVDNLPTTLIPTLAKLSMRAGGDIEKVAIVVDVREGGFLSSFPKIFRRRRRCRQATGPGSQWWIPPRWSPLRQLYRFITLHPP